MAEKMVEKSCAEFADELAKKVSVPGGGSATAYCGALAVALCSMAGNFTVGKNAQYDEDVRRMLRECEETRARLLELAEEDVAAFLPLSKAYRLPKDDPDRADVIEQCTKDAIAAPIETMRQAARTVELLEEMAEKCSRLLASDVGCGAAMAAATLQAASINVFVNTKALRDRAFAEKVEVEADELLRYVSRAQSVAEAISSELRS